MCQKLSNFYLQLRPFPQIPGCESTCLFEISTWMSNKVLRLIISKNKHLLFSFQKENLPPTPVTTAFLTSVNGNSILLTAQVKGLVVILDYALPLSCNLSGKPAGWASETYQILTASHPHLVSLSHHLVSSGASGVLQYSPNRPGSDLVLHILFKVTAAKWSFWHPFGR